MLAISPEVKIFLNAEPVDMRKNFDGFFGIIKSDLNLDVRDGGLFLFLNLRRNRMKILYWDRDGLAIWMKSLEKNCFQRPVRGKLMGTHIFESKSGVSPRVRVCFEEDDRDDK